LDAKCLWRDIDAMAVSKSLSKLSDFQPAIASPYRVLHQVQGDKQEINPIWLKSSWKTNGSTQRNDVLRPRKMGLSWFLSFISDTGLKQRAVHCISNENEHRTHTPYKLGAALSRYSISPFSYPPKKTSENLAIFRGEFVPLSW
ncbi:MAG: hypothetical protein PUF09_07350, partial [Bacteroidales bacterium]|nr:hypothetical protein [Bacteroidales bacterium]